MTAIENKKIKGVPPVTFPIPAEVALLRTDTTFREEKLEGEPFSHYLYRAVLNMESLLQSAGVKYRTYPQYEIEMGKPINHSVAILPGNWKMTRLEIASLKVIVPKGLKMLVGYQAPAEILELLDIELKESVDCRPGQFSKMRFTDAARQSLPGLPSSVSLSEDAWHRMPWRLSIVEPKNKNEVIAYWYDKEDKNTNYPAVVLSENGILVTHLLMLPIREDAVKMLVSLLSRFAPEIRKNAAETLLAAQAGDISYSHSLDEVEGIIRNGKKENKETAESEKHLKLANLFRKESMDMLAKKDYLQAYLLAREAKRAAEDSYCSLFSSGEDKMRGVWCSLTPPGGWEETVKVLENNGFDTAVPNIGKVVKKIQLEVLGLPADADILVKEEKRFGECIMRTRSGGIKVYGWVAFRLEDDMPALVDIKNEVHRGPCINSGRNREIILKTFSALAERYEMYGLAWDNEWHICYCPTCRRKFQEETGTVVDNWWNDVQRSGRYYQKYVRWWTDNFTKFFGEVINEVKKVRPDLLMVSCTGGGKHIEMLGHDLDAWITGKMVDIFCPMRYTDNVKKLERDVKEDISLVAGRISFCPILNPDDLFVSFSTPVQLVDQIALIRMMGAEGFSLYEYSDETLGENFLPALRKGLTK